MKFQERVWKLLRQIPKGKITTYKILANELRTKAYRAVGTACARNPHAPTVPCHRVVNSDGRVGNSSCEGGVTAKIKILEKEGIRVKENKIRNFDKVLFRF